MKISNLGICLTRWAAVLSVGALFAGVLYARPARPEDTRPAGVTFTITAAANKASTTHEIVRVDIQVYNQAREKVQVQDLRREPRLYLAVLVDDSLDSAVANNWSDLKAFFAAQPPSTYIGVFYARNGAAMPAQDFTKDHELAQKALSLPLGSRAAFSSPYLAVQDLMKRWPSAEGRRSIILISSGIDYFRGYFGPSSPDLDASIDHAQKQNINIWSVYWPDTGHIGRTYFRILNAQSDLSRLSAESGAESYFLGAQPPVSLQPYFDEIAEHLRNQYLLTVPAMAGSKGKFEHLRVVTELPRIEFLVPGRVYIPPAK